MVTTKRKVKSVIADPSSLSTISSSFHSTLVDRRIKAIKSCGNWNSALLNGRRSRGPQWDFATASYHVPRNSLEYFTGVTRIDSREDDGSLTKTPAGSNPSSSMSSNIQKPQPMYLTSSNQAQERHMHSLNQQRQAPHDINMNSPRRPPSQQRTNHVRNFSSTTQGPYSSSLGHFPTPGSSDMPSQSFPGAPNSIIPPSLPDPKSMVFLQKPPQPQNFTNNQAGYPVGVGGPNYAQKINPPNNASGLLGTLNPSLVQQHPEHKNDGSLTSNSYDNLNMPSQHPEKQQNPSQMVNQRFSPLRPTAGSFEKPQLGQADVATNSAFCKVASSKPQSLVQEQQLNSASQKFFNVQPPSLPHSQNNVNPNSNQNLSQNSAQHVQMSSHTFQPGQAPLSDAAKARPASYSMQGAQNFKFPGNPGGVQPTIPMPQADQNQFNQFPRYQPAHSSSHLMSTNLNQPNNSLNNGRPLPPQQQQQYIPGLPLTNNSPRLQHIGEQNSPS